MADDTDTPETTPAKPRATRRRAAGDTSAATPPAARKPRAAKAKPADSAPAPTPAPAKRKAPPKPRSTKRAAPPTTARKVVDQTRTAAKTATDKVGGKWGAAAIAGGLAAVGAATAALLSLRSSAAKAPAPKPVDPKHGAHQADGTDSSKSFEAGIADEGTIPE